MLARSKLLIFAALPFTRLHGPKVLSFRIHKFIWVKCLLISSKVADNLSRTDQGKARRPAGVVFPARQGLPQSKDNPAQRGGTAARNALDVVMLR